MLSLLGSVLGFETLILSSGFSGSGLKRRRSISRCLPDTFTEVELVTFRLPPLGVPLGALAAASCGGVFGPPPFP